MSTIKIKLKDTITVSESTSFNITFSSNGNSYDQFDVGYHSGKLLTTIQYVSNSSVTIVYDNTLGWSYTNPNYQYIEIDPTQANFQSFITAMKDNILGVELETGTYKWVDNPYPSSALTTLLNFNSSPSTSARNEFDSIGFVENLGSYNLNYYRNGISFSVFTGEDGNWVGGDGGKTITTTENQYIDYDFYNYAILGNQLVKQGSTTATIESGTYIWNDTPIVSTDYSTDLNFTSLNVEYTRLSTANNSLFYWLDEDNNQRVYIGNSQTWSNNNWKTIQVPTNQEVSTDFKTWFDSNTTKQTTPTSYTITDNLTNVSPASSNVYQIDQGGTRSLTYTWSTQYVVGVNNINVVNADYTPTFSGNSVTLALSNPSGNVTINITASEGDFEFNITENGTTTLATENTIVKHDIVFKVNVPPTPTVEVQSALNMASGNQVITPEEGKTMTKVTIVKPSTFTAENIKKGVIIGYITGTYEGLVPDGTAIASTVRAGYTFYGNGTSKLTGTMQDYIGYTTITSNQTLQTAGKYMPTNLVINVPNPTLSGNALASQVLKGQKFYSNSYTIQTGTLESYDGNYTITENGTYSTSGKYLNSDIVVSVAGIVEVSTSTEMDNKLVQANVGQYYKFTGTTDDKYTNGDIYQVEVDS